MLLFWILLLALSLYIMGVICDQYFVNSLEKIAQKFKMSSDAAGATLMAIGSSAPELFVSLSAVFIKDAGAPVGAGTIVGSALFNILVIIGCSVIIKEATINWQPLMRDMLFYTISIIILLLFFLDGKISWIESLSFLFVYLIYVIAVIYWKKILPYQEKKPEEIEEPVLKKEKSCYDKITQPLDIFIGYFFPKAKHYFLNFFISILFIALLSFGLVESAKEIALITGIPKVIIALVILAAGTSVSDLISSVIAAKKGYGGMAVSNAIGSNVFDILIGLGLPWFLIFIINGAEVQVQNDDLYSSIILLLASVLLVFFVFFFQKWKVGKKSGYFLIGFYCLYLMFLIGKNI